MTKKSLDVYLVSDSSGETVIAVSKATLVQFPEADFTEHIFLLVRTKDQVDSMIEAFRTKPGIVFYTMGNCEARDYFLSLCKKFSIPAVSPLDELVDFVSDSIDMTPSDTKPGKYKALDQEYYEKINSINFSIQHDDGQHTENYEKADIVLLGISRTSKSPTSLYLGQRGYNVANYPIIIGLPLNIPKLETILNNKTTVMIGLTIMPQQLGKIRSARLSLLCDDENPLHSRANKAIMHNYSSDSSIREEIAYANSIFRSLGIPVIDVSNKAIEETAAEIINLYNLKDHKN
jgi:regulator of PEP synthase PpsR (kinase-PPPase family)